MNPPPNSFVLLRDELKARLLLPIEQVSFWVNLVIGVILFGGIAVWFEILKYASSNDPKANFDNVLTAIYAYFPALAWASSMQLVMANDGQKYLRSFAYGVSSILLLISIVLLFDDKLFPVAVSFIIAIVSSIAAIGMWWIANGREEMFVDSPIEPDAPVGGPITVALKGDVSQFKT